MFCSKCGREIPEGVAFCPMCGAVVAQPVQPPVQSPFPAPTPQDRGPVNGGPVSPPRNPLATCSYYFGLGALIALVLSGVLATGGRGLVVAWVLIFLLPMGIAALVTGICGLAYAHRRPEGRGTGDAVLGVVMGSLGLAVTAIVLFGGILFRH